MQPGGLCHGSEECTHITFGTTCCFAVVCLCSLITSEECTDITHDMMSCLLSCVSMSKQHPYASLAVPSGMPSAVSKPLQCFFLVISTCLRKLIARQSLSSHCERDCRLAESTNCMADGTVMMAISAMEQTATGPPLLKALSLIGLDCLPRGLKVP